MFKRERFARQASGKSHFGQQIASWGLAENLAFGLC